MDHTAREWVTTTTILHDLRDARNDRAWERFVNRFRDPLVAFARRSGLSQADADDAAQETLVELARSLRDGRYDRDKGRLSAWLFGIARRCVLRHRQREARSRERTTDDDAMRAIEQPTDEKPVEDLWNTEWERWAWTACLERARAEFEPATLRAFLLAVQSDRAADSIAEELRVPVKAVYNAKHRVLKRLRELRDELDNTA
ncbi:MAG TPA: sigma-70 family RNA polymerase sigma factor [Phycisphaerales bacterium]|nr:sigma-70 family RNA polymerase sigma factor [Phycisphaerales bacterium]